MSRGQLPGEFLFIAGQVPVNAAGKLVGAGDFEAQARQVFRNIGVALKSAGAGYGNIVQFTTYLVDSRDIPKLRKFRERNFKKYFRDGQYPPNTLLVIDRLAGEEMRLEDCRHRGALAPTIDHARIVSIAARLNF